ncbi:hypothetical protein EC915_103129 [Pseudomonas sp. LP_7_YM]|nr:hypothetical protein EC915_103129 [Pseudomonas sp. LP_7_YM]
MSHFRYGRDTHSARWFRLFLNGTLAPRQTAPAHARCRASSPKAVESDLNEMLRPTVPMASQLVSQRCGKAINVIA